MRLNRIERNDNFFPHNFDLHFLKSKKLTLLRRVKLKAPQGGMVGRKIKWNGLYKHLEHCEHPADDLLSKTFGFYL